jgi:hypothetical protein
MAMQLVLIDETERQWRLDDRTREVGRRGIAAARDVLRKAARRNDEEADEADHGVRRAA